MGFCGECACGRLGALKACKVCELASQPASHTPASHLPPPILPPSRPAGAIRGPAGRAAAAVHSGPRVFHVKAAGGAQRRAAWRPAADRTVCGAGSGGCQAHWHQRGPGERGAGGMRRQQLHSCSYSQQTGMWGRQAGSGWRCDLSTCCSPRSMHPELLPDVAAADAPRPAPRPPPMLRACFVHCRGRLWEPWWR